MPLSPTGFSQSDHDAPPLVENRCHSLSSPPRANTSRRPGAHDTIVGSPFRSNSGLVRLAQSDHDDPFQNVLWTVALRRATTSTRSVPRTAVASTPPGLSRPPSGRGAMGPLPGPGGRVLVVVVEVVEVDDVELVLLVELVDPPVVVLVLDDVVVVRLSFHFTVSVLT